MSAETLRRAASLMRARAEAAPAGYRWVESDNAVWRVNNPTNTTADALTHRFPVWADGAAEHIASWHPAVALAVADWLGSVARDVDKRDNPQRVGGRYEALRIPDEHAALAVARAYLGESA